MLFASLLVCLFASSAFAVVNPIVGSQCSKNQVIRKLTVYEDGALEAECGPVPCGEIGRRCIDDQTACRAESDVFSGMRWAPNGESILLRCCTAKTANKIYVGTDIVSAGSFYEGGAVAQKEFYSPTAGSEYDFIANARTEQGGVRVWVFRIICEKGEKPVDFDPITTTPAMSLAPLVVKTTTMAPVKQTTTTEAVEEPEDDQEEEGSEDAEVEESNDAEETTQETTEAEETEEAEEEEVATPEPKPFNPLRYRPPHYPRSSTGIRRV